MGSLYDVPYIPYGETKNALASYQEYEGTPYMKKLGDIFGLKGFYSNFTTYKTNSWLSRIWLGPEWLFICVPLFLILLPFLGMRALLFIPFVFLGLTSALVPYAIKAKALTVMHLQTPFLLAILLVYFLSRKAQSKNCTVTDK